MTTYTISQGETGPIKQLRPSHLGASTELDSNWKCYIAVLDSAGADAMASREVTTKTDDDLKFEAALTPAETTLLSASDKGITYDVVTEVYNTTTTPPFNKEKRYKLVVTTQGIT